MKRRTFIKSSVGLGLGWSGIAAAQAAGIRPPATEDGPAPNLAANPNRTGKPHIILLMTDQHRGDALGCMGNKAIKTPNLDRLAAEGTLFVSAYSSTPSSTPARSGLLTGLSPWHHGMLGYGALAEKYKYEMPQMLRDEGYYTFGIGKMHWNPQNALHGFHGTLVDESGRVESENFISDYRKWFQVQAPAKNPDQTGIGWNDHAAGTYQLDEKLHPTTWTGQTACELIRNYDADQPLFLKVSFARPHSPYDPPQRYLDMYEGVEMPVPAKGDWCEPFAELKRPDEMPSDAPFANFGDSYAQNSCRHYYANITFIDDQIGHILDALKARGMYDDALICFTADHGDMMGDHYHWRKTYPYEGSTHIPYILKWPKGMKRWLPDGAKVDYPVELRDFLPTFLEIAGAKVPDDMDGRSLCPLVQQANPAWRKYIDLEHATCYAAENYWCGLTDGKRKYVWNLHNGTEQLFDLEKDPQETHNYAADADYASVLEEMRTALAAHLEERGETFVRDGKLQTRAQTMLYSPNFPKKTE